MDMPRRRIEELLARYELEPLLADVYVEGSVDADLVNWYLHERGIPHVEAYEIQTVEVPENILEKHGLTQGNRQRVMALALELEGRVREHQVVCIIDRDFDNWLDDRPFQPTLLLRTDYTGIELYLLGLRTIGKFLQLVVSDQKTSGESLIQNLRSVLEECFLVRLAHRRLGLPLDWLTPERCCRLIEGGEVIFDRDDFLGRLLLKNRNRESYGSILAAMEEYRARLRTDLRHQSHGHDFTLILGWYLGKKGDPWLREPLRLVRALLGCLEVSDLEMEPLFREIETRFRR